MLDLGNSLFRNNSLAESANKYKTGLRKLPEQVDEDWEETFDQLRTLFLLNLSRCERMCLKGELKAKPKLLNTENDSELN